MKEGKNRQRGDPVKEYRKKEKKSNEKIEIKG